MMKRRSWGVILLVLFLVGCYANAQYVQRNQLPERDTFQLDVQCEEGLKPGDTGEIAVSLENTGEQDYFLDYTNLFVVSVDGKQITIQEDGTDGWALPSGDEVSENYEFVAGTPGKHKVIVQAQFQIQNQAGDSRSYRYEEKTWMEVMGKE